MPADPRGAADLGVDELDADLARDNFEARDQLRIFQMKRVPGRDRRAAAVRLAGKNFLIRHESAAEVRGFELVIAIKTVGARKIGQLNVELKLECVFETRPGSPEKMNSHLPGWLCRRIKIGAADAQIFEEVLGECGGGALADADHTERGTSHDPDLQPRNFAFERNRRDKTALRREQVRF